MTGPLGRKRGPYRKPPPARSIAELYDLYRLSPRWRGWSDATRAQRARILDAFALANGRQPVASLTRGAVIALRDQASGPGAAVNFLKALSGMLDYAVDLEWIAANPVSTVPRPGPVNPDGFACWSDDDIDRYLAHWPRGSTPRLAMMLMLCVGASVADAVQLGRQHVQGDRISYRRQKMRGRGGVTVDVPILPELAAEIAMVPPGRLTFLETAYGQPRSPKALTVHLAAWARAAGLEGRSAHGLRKARARILAEHGARPQAIMAWLGHRSIAMSLHYSAAYDRARAADEAAELLANISPAQKSRKVVNFPKKH